MASKPRLLIVSDYYYPHWTGIAKSMFYSVEELSRYFTIYVLTVKHKKNLLSNERNNHCKIIRTNVSFNLSRSKYSFPQINEFIKIARKSDYILINSPCANIVVLGLISKVLRKKLIIFHNGDLILPRGIINYLIERIFDASSLVSFFLADVISTHSQDYANHSRVMKPFLRKTRVVSLPVIIEKQRERIRNFDSLKKTKDGKIFGFAGRFVEEKGFDILFDAIGILKRRGLNFHFLFAGETKMEYEDFYEKNKKKLYGIKDQITFLGLLNQKQMATFYSLIDYVVVPSRSDCFPLVQSEAMLSGVPSVVADIPGARYLVKESKFGTVFKKDDKYDLAQKIIEISSLTFSPNSFKNLKTLLDNKGNAKKLKEIITG